MHVSLVWTGARVARKLTVRDILEENMAVDVGGLSLQRDASNERWRMDGTEN
jgi:hypothetical protein